MCLTVYASLVIHMLVLHIPMLHMSGLHIPMLHMLVLHMSGLHIPVFHMAVLHILVVLHMMLILHMPCFVSIFVRIIYETIPVFILWQCRQELFNLKIIFLDYHFIIITWQSANASKMCLVMYMYY